MAIKHVALSAVAVAAAGAANAQSSVALYGIVDLYGQYANGAGSVTRLQSGGLNGSRLGVRGSEDLGGGLRAVFTAETGINADDGTVGQGGVFWGRQIFVGLASPYGTLTLGRQYSSVYTATNEFSAFTNGPYGASTAVIGGFGTYEPVRGAGDEAGSSTGLGGPARVNNSAKYESPSLSGVKIGALYGLGELSGSPNDNRTYDIYARYTAGSLDAIISFVDDKISTGTPLNAQTLTVAATYSFGDLRVLGGYLQTDDRSAANADGKGYWVGGEYRFGVHLVRAQYVANDPDAANIDSQVFGVGYQYDLSKRTALYTSVTYFKNEGRARWHGSVPAGLATDTNSDITEFVVGIRHSF